MIRGARHILFDNLWHGRLLNDGLARHILFDNLWHDRLLNDRLFLNPVYWVLVNLYSGVYSHDSLVIGPSTLALYRLGLALGWGPGHSHGMGDNKGVRWSRLSKISALEISDGERRSRP